MTHVINYSASSLSSNRKLKWYTIEVITYDGESEVVEIEARDDEEAQDLAAAQFNDVDYTMGQGCYIP